MGDFLSMLGDFWEVARFPLGGLACLAGGLLCIVSAIGVLRFPDFYTRMHAASITETAGTGFLLIGMALMAPNWLVLVKLLCIFIFLFLTNPTSSHALVNAAHVAGLQPRIGPVGAANREDEA
ncbi:MAG: sodium:proton antiporter [Alphaproteobacteria bacterium HGW-Alphaproteobacteria-18]|nr:MAG: sodium:proton antiporter [Alphaproteobacteria bacterium HGW-Alphaproteobacteria-18]